jgi:hypothetical protein
MMENLNIDQGDDIVDILPRLINEIDDIAEIDLFILNAAKDTQRVVDQPELAPIVAEALDLRKEYRVPFWEAVLLIARRDNGKALDLVLDAAIHHQPMTSAAEAVIMTTKDQFARNLRTLTTEVDERRIVTLSSRVTAKSSESVAHLQMLDFRIRPNEENEHLAAEILMRVGVEGILLNSGNSYHFYGNRLMRSDTELASFLGRVSLFAPFVDQRWIAHQMIEGACALRISRGKSFARPPTFVRYVNAT